MDVLYSINKAADQLERDRQTLVRALRHTKPDGYERGQPRYTMKTIVDALAVKPKARHETGKYRDRYAIRGSSALDELRVTFEQQIALISAENSIDKRREMAVALAPVLQQYQAAYLEAGRSLRIADDHVLGNRADLTFGEMVEEVADAAGWPRHDGQFLIKMIEAA